MIEISFICFIGFGLGVGLGHGAVGAAFDSTFSSFPLLFFTYNMMTDAAII